jgi:retinol dehydrogenase 12
MQLGSPAGGIQFDKNGAPLVLKGMDNYMQSKVGGCWLASKFAERFDKDRIMSVVSPGSKAAFEHAIAN